MYNTRAPKLDEINIENIHIGNKPQIIPALINNQSNANRLRKALLTYFLTDIMSNDLKAI